MADLTALEMFSRLVSMGYATPANIEPSAHMIPKIPKAYVSVEECRAMNEWGDGVIRRLNAPEPTPCAADHADFYR